MQNNLLKVKNLKVTYGKKKKQVILFDSFNYEFAKDNVYFILGKTGVGKSTLVSYFNGLRKSKTGDIFIKDSAILSSERKIKDYKEIRKIIQLVFQFPEKQIFKSTVLADASFGPENLGFSKDKAKALAIEYLNKLGINDSLFQVSPLTLSSGQKRRIAIAGILAITPDIFIFDEPTVSLDPQAVNEMIDIIKSLKKQHKTIIVISHNTNLALELADEVLILHNKQVISSNNVYELFNDNKVLSTTKLATPNIIETINKLGNSSLHKMQPRTIDELADIINSYMKGGK